jgi:glycosyltransferase involved in cell wall biosynthesis
MARLIRKGDYQIAHVKSGLGRFAIAEAKRKGVKVLVDHSAGAPQFVVETVDRENWFDHHSFWWTVMQDCNDADILMVDCDWVKETFLMYGYPAEKIRVVYMGLDQKFNGLRDWTNENMVGLGTPENPLRIVFSGPFQPHKGNEAFLEAINCLAKTKLCFDVDVIGTVTIDDEVRNRCQLAMKKITFYGHVPQDQMCELMKSAHVYLFPSRSEGCAKSAFEAMSMGLCVVCTKETGLPLKNGEDGHLILKDNATSIAEKIEYLVQNPELIKKTGMNATETLKKYTWDNYAKNVEEVYGELLAK